MTTTQPESRNFTEPDEVREFPKGRLEFVKIGGATVGRATLQPGWRCTANDLPGTNDKSCQDAHFLYHVSGVMGIRTEDGREIECHPGDVSTFPARHEAWVVGDQPVVVIDWQGMIEYAKLVLY